MEKKEEKMTWRETWRISKRAFLLLDKYAPRMYLCIVLCAAVTAVTPYVTVFLSARIIDELAGARRPEILWRWVAVAVAAAGVLSLFSAALGWLRTTRTNAFAISRYRIYSDKQMDMDYADLEKQSTRDLLAQIKQNDWWMGLGLTKVPYLFENIMKNGVGIVGAVALTVGLFLTRVPESAGALTMLDDPVGILALAVAVAIPTVLGPWLGGKVLRLDQGETMAEQARLGNRIFSAFGFPASEQHRQLDIRMYNQHTFARHYMRQNKTFSADGPMAKLHAGKAGLMSAASAGMSALSTGAVYLYVCLKAWAGAFAVGMATQYIGAVTALTGNVRGLLSDLSELRHNAAYLRLAFEFLDIPNSMYQGSLTTEKRSDRQYDVEFRDVSFKYPGSDNWALRHVSVKFKVGRRLAVVGENGSGKTTFIKLLCRLYDPQEGEILLNGIDIRKYNYRDYMDVFSVVFQDFQLLSQPIGANVAGSANYDKERVLQSLTDAGFGERLAPLPDGLDTQLYRDFDGEGVMISGGEAQKIAIARALCKDSPFIILDEPTAALDPMAEAEIYAQFNEISGDKTAIYISHRLSSCKFCDEILVFHDGQIIQQGTHDELAAEETGKYHELWHAQAQYYTE